MWDRSREWQEGLVAAIRADLHNTSARQFEQHFKPKDFMPGAEEEVEEKVAALVAQGYNPAAAAAIVMSKQTNEQKIHLINGLKGSKAKPGKRIKKG